MCRSLTNGLGWTATLIACFGMAMIAFSSCAHAEKKPPCVSACGMLLQEDGNGSMSCDVLQDAEDAVLKAFDELKDKDQRLSKENMCKEIFGWQLHLNDNVIMIDSSIGGGRPFIGLSNCKSKEMWLMANQSWRKGSYPHEIVHVAQDCTPPKAWGKTYDPEKGPGHNGWDENGVSDIIDDFRGGRR